MNDLRQKQPEPKAAPARRWHKTVRTVAWCVSALVLLAVAAVIGLTFWLTPPRLSALANRQASQWLDADVQVDGLEFTFWSTLPHFILRADSMRITSRTLDGITPEIRRQLPPDASFLASARRFEASVNVWALLRGRIEMRGVSVDSLRLNLVAYNDSINNYNIIPDHTRLPEKVPYISADYISLTHPQPFAFTSVATDTRVDATLDMASLRRHGKESNQYRLSVSGKGDMTVGRLHVLRGFPFRLGGMVRLGFDPLMVRLSNYDISLGNILGHLSMNADLDGEPTFNSLSYSIDSFRPLAVLQYLDPSVAAGLGGLEADLDVSLAARLTSPWRPTAQALPSVVVNLEVPSGTASYTFADGKVCRVESVQLSGRLDFDGQRPDSSYISVPRAHVTSDGLDLTLSGRVTGLMASPRVEGKMRCLADLNTVLANACGAHYLHGQLTADTRFGFCTDSLATMPLKALHFTGQAQVEGLHVDFPSSLSPASLDARMLAVEFSDAPTAGATAAFKAEVEGNGLAFASGPVSGTASQLKAAGQYGYDYSLDAQADVTGLAVNDEADSLALALQRLAVALTAPDCRRPLDNVHGSVKANHLTGHTPELGFGLDRLAMSLANTPRTTTLAQDSTGAQSYAPPGSTPSWLVPHLQGKFARWLAANDFRANITADGGDLKSPRFPTDNTLRHLDATITPDSMALHRLALRAGGTAMHMDGTATGLRPFLLSAKPETLRLDMDVALDTVNINYLALTYENGMKMAGADTASPDTVQPADTVSIMIPRNILAEIRARARETVYTDLHLLDLYTRLHVADGLASVDTLHVASDFGAATLRLQYDTRNRQDMALDVAATLDTIDLVRFFRNFHALLMMMPQMSNLSGSISAQAQMHLGLFPDMYADLPSLTARIGMQGRGLKVHQSKFIRRITRMMLIHTDDDLHIANMDVNASVHDDLLELYPFVFEFDSYRLRMEGLNNFEGQLYYHIGLEKSPLHLPFGINIQGTYSHPELRFGGVTYKEERGRRLTQTVTAPQKVNIVAEARKYIKEFIRNAARAAR